MSGNTYLPDRKASITFEPSTKNLNDLRISFGYTSPDFKNYSRDLNIDVYQMIELRDYLNSIINANIDSEDRYYIVIDPFQVEKIRKYTTEFHIENTSKRLIDNFALLKISGYSYKLIKEKTLQSYFFDLVKSDEESDIFYLPYCRIPIKYISKINSILDVDAGNQYMYYGIKEIDVERGESKYQAYYHTIQTRRFDEKINGKDPIWERITYSFEMIGLNDEQINSNLKQLKKNSL